MKNIRCITDVVLIIFILVYASGILFSLFQSTPPFFDWDEGIYAQVGREMIQKKSLIPLWQGHPWLDKPPLVPLMYGVVSLVPILPEISTRLLTLLVSCLVLIMAYNFFSKIGKRKDIALLTVVITAFIPIYFQRSQSLNVDIFLLAGWFGYFLFYRRFFAGTAFLTLGVLSKSLLGWFPAAMLFGYYILAYFVEKKSRKEHLSQLKQILFQVFFSSWWFFLMIAMYKGEFIQAQFIESHLKRMTASIESHFGQRTFYLDLLFEQFGILKFPMIIGSLIVCFQTLRKKNILTGVMLCIFVPWFVLLNLTKTKIAWYLHPVIPQFAFLASYVLFPFKKIVATILLIGILASIFYWNFVVHPFYKTQFSKTEEYQQIAISARNTCTSLEVLVEAQGRKAHDTLSQMNLLISTSEWWGNHPSMAYYYGGPTSYIYSINRLISEYDKKNKDFCIAFEKTDMLYLKTLIDKGKIINTNSQWVLLKKID